MPEGADPAPFGALERLAGSLGDPTLVAEARAEFRRTVAADPVSHQMVSDSARLRALAADELDRASSVDERPPLVALLPERFAIEELRHAIRQVLQRSEPDHETSSNFRRRIADLIHSGVLVPSGELVEPSGKGRPAQLYSFDRSGWRRWLAECAHALRLREHHATSIRASRSSPKGSDLERQAYENVVEWTRRGGLPEAPRARSEQVQEILAKQIEPARRASEFEADSRHFHARSERPGDPQRDRVERLERLVQSLAGRIDELSKRHTEPPAGPPGSSSNP